MKLIDLLVKELKEWHKDAACYAQDANGAVYAYRDADLYFSRYGWYHRSKPSVISLRVTRYALTEDYRTAIVTREQYEAALAASQQPAWNGNGLPPVGCECEVKRAIDWMRCKILFISEAHVVLLGEEECCWQTQACQFRPILTEADRKRKSVTEAMIGACTNYNKTDVIHAVGQIYDAIKAGKIKGLTTVPTVSQIVHCTEKCTREDAERIVTMLTSGTISE